MWEQLAYCCSITGQLGKPRLRAGEETKERLKKLPGGATMPLTIHLRQVRRLGG